MTKSKTVGGIFFRQNQFISTEITLRVTVDNIGQSMSLSDDERGIMLQIPLESVKSIIKPAGTWTEETQKKKSK